MRGIKRFMQSHQIQKSTGKETITPENTLLFSPTETPLRQKLLPEYFSWLSVPPLIEVSGTLDSYLYVMPHSDWIRSCCFSPDDRLVASSSDDHCVRLWSVKTGKLQEVLEGFDSYVYRVVMSRMGASGHTILVASESSAVRIWDISTGKLLKILPGIIETQRVVADEDTVSSAKYGTANVRDIDITMAGDKLVIAVESDITILEISGFKKVSVWSDGTIEPVRCVRFSPDGKLVAASIGKDITIWEVESGQRLRRLLGHESQSDESSGDEASSDNISEVGNLGHTKNIDGLSFSPDSKFLASGSDDRTARIWEVATGKMLTALTYHDRHVNTVCFSPDGDRLATGSTDYTIGIWKPLPSGQWGSGGEERKHPDQILAGHTGMIYSVSFAARNENLLASVASDGDLRVWNTNMAEKTTKTRSKMKSDQTGGTNAVAVDCGPGHRRPVVCLALSLDGSMIASASPDGVICLWDGMTGARRYTTSDAHYGEVKSLVFSHEGMHLVSASTDCQACVWDFTSMKSPKYRLEGHTNWVRDVAISPNGHLVATASDDCTVRVWDIHAAGQNVENGNSSDVPVSVFRSHTDYVYSVAFSPDSRHLASAGDDLHVKIWNLADGDAIQEDKEASDVDMFDNRVGFIRGVAFSSDGKKVVSVYANGTVTVWSPDFPKEMQCCLIMRTHLHPGPFRYMRIDREFPDVLLTEFGACKCDISEVVPEKAAVDEGAEAFDSTSLLEHRPEHAPFGIGEGGRWITWKNHDLIYLPEQYRPANRNYYSCLVQGYSVVVGCNSGQVLLFKFSEDANTRLENIFREST